jgi:hypothetical protein
MDQKRPAQQQNNLNMIYWAVAAEPAILALIGIFLRNSRAVNASLSPDLEEPLLVAFLVISSVFAWLSLRFASGRDLLPKLMNEQSNPAGFRLAAIMMAAAPGMFGFLHYLFFGKMLAPLFLNGGAVALAAKHIVKFSEKASALTRSPGRE